MIRLLDGLKVCRRSFFGAVLACCVSLLIRINPKWDYVLAVPGLRPSGGFPPDRELGWSYLYEHEMPGQSQLTPTNKRLRQLVHLSFHCRFHAPTGEVWNRFPQQHIGTVVGGDSLILLTSRDSQAQAREFWIQARGKLLAEGLTWKALFRGKDLAAVEGNPS